MPVNDADLLRRYAVDKSEAAFAELLRRYLDGVYSAALRRVGGDVHLAEDVSQHVFVALAQHAGQLARHPVLSGWLYLTTRNESANVVRRECRRKLREQEAQAMHETSTNETASIDWSHVAPLLDAAIDQLSDKDRTVVLLRFVDGRGFADIGTRLQLTSDAARMRVDRAVEKLRTLLARRGITSTSAALGTVLTSHVVTAAPAGLSGTITGAASTVALAANGSWLALLKFMMTSKIVTGTAAAVIVGVIGYTWGARERNEADRPVLDEGSKTSAMEPLAPPMTSSLAMREGTTTVQKPAMIISSEQAPDLVVAAEQQAFQAKLKANRAISTDTMFAPMYHELGWNESQREQFRSINLARLEGGDRLARHLMKTGQELDKDTSQAMFEVLGEEMDKELRSSFGEDMPKVLRQFEATRPVRSLVEQLSKSLYGPRQLTSEQTTALVNIIVTNSMTADGKISVRSANVERIIADSAPLLSAEQQRSLQTLLEAQAGTQPLLIGSAPRK